jgi:Ca-activated chloride channel family protein
LTDVKVSFDGLDAYDVEPKSIPTVFAERPVVVRGKWKGARQGTVTVKGMGGQGAFSQTLALTKTQPVSEEGSNALSALWARARVDTLQRFGGDEAAAITALGLKYHLLTQYTSFIAVDRTAPVVTQEGVDVSQPAPLPQGVEDAAVQGAEPSLWLLVLGAMAMLVVMRRRVRA